MTSDSSTDNPVFTVEDESFPTSETYQKVVAFIDRLVSEYGITLGEREAIEHAMLSYVEANRSLGTAAVLAGILEKTGHVFTDDMPNPIPENEQNASESSEKLMNELFNTSMTAGDINAVLSDIRAVGVSALKRGTNMAFDMIDLKE